MGPHRIGRICALAGLAVLVGVLVGTARSADARSSLDHGSLERLLRDLTVEADRLSEDLRRALDRGGRWEPRGADLALWDDARGFLAYAHLVSNEFGELGSATASYDGIERDVVGLLERGRDLERDLDRITTDRFVREDWQRVRRHLDRLAESYGWDYARGQFGSGFGSGGAFGSDPADPFGSSSRGPDASQAVAALAEVDRATQALRSRLRFGTSTGDAVKGIAESLLRDLAQGQGAADPRTAWKDQLEADLANLTTAAAEADAEIRRTRDGASGRAQVQSMLRDGVRARTLLAAHNQDREVEEAWEALREDLNRLAALYSEPEIR